MSGQRAEFRIGNHHDAPSDPGRLVAMCEDHEDTEEHQRTCRGLLQWIKYQSAAVSEGRCPWGFALEPLSEAARARLDPTPTGPAGWCEQCQHVWALVGADLTHWTIYDTTVQALRRDGALTRPRADRMSAYDDLGL